MGLVGVIAGRGALRREVDARRGLSFVADDMQRQRHSFDFQGKQELVGAAHAKFRFAFGSGHFAKMPLDAAEIRTVIGREHLVFDERDDFELLLLRERVQNRVPEVIGDIVAPDRLDAIRLSVRAMPGRRSCSTRIH